MVTPESIKTVDRRRVFAASTSKCAATASTGRRSIVSARVRGLSKVRQHQLVYAALGDRMREEIHALSMTTLTPAQWAAARADYDGANRR